MRGYDDTALGELSDRFFERFVAPVSYHFVRHLRLYLGGGVGGCDRATGSGKSAVQSGMKSTIRRRQRRQRRQHRRSRRSRRSRHRRLGLSAVLLSEHAEQLISLDQSTRLLQRPIMEQYMSVGRGRATVQLGQTLRELHCSVARHHVAVVIEWSDDVRGVDEALLGG